MTEADFSAYRTIQEVSEGYISLNPVFLKKYSPGTLRIINRELIKASIAVRAERTDYSNIKMVRDKNMKLSRLTHAIRIVQAYCKERKIQL
ncbi:MAG: hypothetical protein A2161_08915 [Candidatus Schekmanbacteria bacterium RBG_13_48_7]|uniref:Uncharacterized protein n=1 Tax=Candidatus Schekmanbacteria bacterium RBG_13_48_7 TaxID=1817878 RepID=A0A1F7RLY0_9BACT|nr:MAG: hypothetical protein A2161_08915 [Candidatus Schekmanbacteria bacterium RBG_13_48_7]